MLKLKQDLCRTRRKLVRPLDKFNENTSCFKILNVAEHNAL